MNKNLTKNLTKNKFKLESKVLQKDFTKEYLSQNATMSPDLSWTPVTGAQCYAMVCFDPDSVRTSNFVHWILQYIPKEITKIPSIPISREKVIEVQNNKIIQGKNGWGEYGYGGPQPPDDKVHNYNYNFCLFALSNIDKELQTQNYNKNALNKLMETHILETITLIVPYKKNSNNKSNNKSNNNKLGNNKGNNNKLGNNKGNNNKLGNNKRNN